MKRQQAVSKIALEIIKNLDKECKHYSIEKMDNIANSILDSLLKAGMLPPYRKRTEEEKQLVDAYDQYNYIHKWEKE